MTEHEELLMLRALAEKQQQELAVKEQTIEIQKSHIETQQIQIEKQKIQIENTIQALLHARKKMFGPSTEASKCPDGQLSLFETAPELVKELTNEQKNITVAPYKRTARQPGVRAEMLSGLVQEVEFIPARLKVKQILQQVAKCTKCGTQESKHDTCRFQKAAVPAPPLAHSISTPSLLAQVLYQKFVMGMPFARQENDWYRLGLVLPRASMANWSIRCCEEWLMPIYNRIHERLLTCQVLHMDETRIQCNKEAGNKASSDSYMWVMRSAQCEEITAAYFYDSRSRSGETARRLLSGYDGYLITDAYAGYGTVDGITNVMCWAHYPRSIIIREEVP